MDTEQTTNLLLQLLAIEWIVKVCAHLPCLQVEKPSQSINVVNFMSNRRNILRAAHLIGPFYFGAPKGPSNDSKRGLRIIVWISVCLFWMSWLAASLIALNDSMG